MMKYGKKVESSKADRQGRNVTVYEEHDYVSDGELGSKIINDISVVTRNLGRLLTGK